MTPIERLVKSAQSSLLSASEALEAIRELTSPPPTAQAQVCDGCGSEDLRFFETMGENQGICNCCGKKVE